MEWPHRWPRREPRVDERTVGIGFIDVLFGLVIANVLQPFAHVGSVPTVGRVQLVLAGVLTVTSWIGYHNSWNRNRYFIDFPNLPFFQFLVEVALVVLYFLIAITAPSTKTSLSNRDFSVVLVSSFVAATFVLYSIWDRLALLIRKDPRYARRTLDKDVPARRYTSYAFAVGTVAAATAVGILRPRGTAAIVTVEVILIVLIVAYRFAKEYVTPATARLSGGGDTIRYSAEDRETLARISRDLERLTGELRSSSDH